MFTDLPFMKSAWPAAAALLSLSACGEDGCPELVICDVAKESCQQRVAGIVRCMRGGTVKLPKVTVLDEDGLRERFEEGDSEVSEEAEAAYTRWNRGLSRFGLAPADYTREDSRDDALPDIAAVYFFDEKDIVIVDRGEPLDSVEAMSTFAHEMVHALQDQEYDLDAYYDTWGGSFDAGLALDALVEGEADLYALLLNIKLRGFSSSSIDWRAYFERWQSDMLREAEESAAPVAQADMHFSYAFGAGFAMQHWLDGGRARIEKLFESPPRTTREVMFGASEVDFEAEASALQERAVPALEAPFEASNATTLGAWITRIFAGKPRLPVARRLDAAQALTADEFSVHYNPETDQVVSAWRVRAESSAATAAWPGASSKSFQSMQDGDEPEVAMLGSDDESLDVGALAWQAPAAKEDEEEGEAAGIRLAAPWKRTHRGRLLACRTRRPALSEKAETDETR